ncbi:MAG TPA: hypothetical protein VMR21_02240, partial [Vicinamibacteria bacterium]|nr:hypothetical protein [Vicinamibacteria bacterium]
SFRHGRVARSNHPIDGEGISGRRAAWNLGHVIGLDGLATLLPLAVWTAATGAWLAPAARRDDAAPTTSPALTRSGGPGSERSRPPSRP